MGGEAALLLCSAAAAGVCEAPRPRSPAEARVAFNITTAICKQRNLCGTPDIRQAVPETRATIPALALPSPVIYRTPPTGFLLGRRSTPPLPPLSPLLWAAGLQGRDEAFLIMATVVLMRNPGKTRAI